MVLPRELFQAVTSRDMDAVRQFVESNPERVNEYFEGGEYKVNLLCVASMGSGRAEMVRYLISRGADVECRHNRVTPLQMACIAVNPESVALLLQAGANVNRIEDWGNGTGSAITSTLITGHGTDGAGIFECLRLLLRAGLALDVLQHGRITSLEQIIDQRIRAIDYAGHLDRSLDLVRAMRASMYTSASSRLSPWRQFVLAPSVAVLRLRSLAARGRAREVTWDRPGSRSRARGRTPRPIAWLLDPHTPNDIVWNVLAFWNPRNHPWDMLGAV